MSDGVGLQASAHPITPGSGRARTLVGGAIGHFVEWYDWSIYGFLAGIFAGQMFPAARLESRPRAPPNPLKTCR